MWPSTQSLPVETGELPGRYSTADNGCPPKIPSATNSLGGIGTHVSLPGPCLDSWQSYCMSWAGNPSYGEIMIALLSSGINIPTKEPCTLSPSGTWIKNSLLSSVFANLPILFSCLYLTNNWSLVLVLLLAFLSSSCLPTVRCILPWVTLSGTGLNVTLWLLEAELQFALHRPYVWPPTSLDT